jgi:hypothetical protein
MSAANQKTAKSVEGASIFQALWQQRLWWLLPLTVLMVLLGVFYVLGHLSAADSEMYPTTLLSRMPHWRMC